MRYSWERIFSVGADGGLGADKQKPVTPSLGLSLELVKATRLYKAFTEQS